MSCSSKKYKYVMLIRLTHNSTVQLHNQVFSSNNTKQNK